jgi:hypothetical protein
MKGEEKHGGIGEEGNDDSTIPLVYIFLCFVCILIFLN